MGNVSCVCATGNNRIQVTIASMTVTVKLKGVWFECSPGDLLISRDFIMFASPIVKNNHDVF